MNPYDYHVPGPRARAEMKVLREKFAELHKLIESLPGGPSRERSLALTELETAAMWANKACVRSDSQSAPE